MWDCLLLQRLLWMAAAWTVLERLAWVERRYRHGLLHHPRRSLPFACSCFNQPCALFVLLHSCNQLHEQYETVQILQLLQDSAIRVLQCSDITVSLEPGRQSVEGGALQSRMQTDNRPYPAFQMSSSTAAAAAVLAPSADDEEERMRQRREQQEKAGPLSKVSACYAAQCHRMVSLHAICST